MPHVVDMHYRYRIRLDVREAPIAVDTTEYVRFDSAVTIVRRALKARPGLLAQIERAYSAGARREKWEAVWTTPAVRRINASIPRLLACLVREHARRLVGLPNTYIARAVVGPAASEIPQ